MGDAQHAQDLTLKATGEAETAMHMIARLMHGYDEKFSSRLKWLKSLEITSATDSLKINQMLVDVGLYQSEEEMAKEAKRLMKESKKKEKSSLNKKGKTSKTTK